MAGNAKPNIEGLGEEYTLEINEVKLREFNTQRLPLLLDGSIDKSDGYGEVLFSAAHGDKCIEFTTEEVINIWGIGTPYQDSGGRTPQSFGLKKWSGTVWGVMSDVVTQDDNQWYKMISNLEPGKYRLEIKSSYISLNEIYVESLSNKKYLIKENGIYKTIEDGRIKEIGVANVNKKVFDDHGMSSLKGLLELNTERIHSLDGEVSEQLEESLIHKVVVDKKLYRQVASVQVEINGESEVLDVTPTMIDGDTPIPYRVTCSSDYVGYEGYQAFNKQKGSKTNTWYSSKGFPEWIELDFGENQMISGFAFINGVATSGYSECSPKEFILEGSYDGVKYDEIHKETKYPKLNALEEKETYLAEVYNYRYYRFTFTSGYGSIIIIDEIKFLLQIPMLLYYGGKYHRITEANELEEVDILTRSDFEIKGMRNKITLQNADLKGVKVIDKLPARFEVRTIMDNVADSVRGILTEPEFKIIEDLGEKFEVLAWNEKERDNQFIVDATPYNQLGIPTGDKKLPTIEYIKSLFVQVNSEIVKIIFSIDGGNTWLTYINDTWENIQCTQYAVEVGGMTKEILEAIRQEKWQELSIQRIRFAYLLSDNVEVDRIDLTVDMKGSWEGAINGTDYSYRYPHNESLQVDIKKNGDYKINY